MLDECPVIGYMKIRSSPVEKGWTETRAGQQQNYLGDGAARNLEMGNEVTIMDGKRKLRERELIDEG